MRYYLDTEFDGHGGPLLSLALVKENGPSLHIRTQARASDPWVIANVEPLMDRHDADSYGLSVPLNGVGSWLRNFMSDDLDPVIIADSPADIGRFCTALSTGEDGGWASADYPLMTFEVHNVDAYPTTLPGAVQHNAWWDAMALRHLLNSSESSAGIGAISDEGTLPPDTPKMTCPLLGKLIGGCRFKPRYDTAEARGGYNLKSGDARALALINESLKPKTYIHDICETCGQTVKRA